MFVSLSTFGGVNGLLFTSGRSVLLVISEKIALRILKDFANYAEL